MSHGELLEGEFVVGFKDGRERTHTPEMMIDQGEALVECSIQFEDEGAIGDRFAQVTEIIGRRLRRL